MSALAHQLRTPLTVITGYAELLGARDDDETRREAAARILEAADLLALAVDDLLTVFAIDTDALAFDAAPLNVRDAVDAAVARVSALPVTQTFRNAAPDEGPHVTADPDHVARILTNLLVTACRRSPDGCEIGIDVTADGDVAAIAVEDGGLGLDDEERRTLFDRFTAPPAGSRGSGLELYKARRLVELHGGTISAEPGANGGTRITFTLPLVSEDGGE